MGLSYIKLHWCAKIKDEVETLAYQLNEEAERTERPIRRLTVKITPSCCLSEKWRIINLLDDIWMLLPEDESLGEREKLEEARSVTSVAAQFGIAHSIVSRLWRQFQTTGTAIRGSVVVVHQEPHPQMTGDWTTDIAFYRGQKTARWWSVCTTPCTVCTFNACPSEARSLWYREHRHWRDNEWGRVLFTDESRFSLSSDSHRILTWRERGSRNHPSNIIERDRYVGRGVLVYGGIMFGSRTDLHIFDAGSVNGTRYCNEILLPYVRLFRGAMGLQFLFMDDNAPCHRQLSNSSWRVRILNVWIGRHDLRISIPSSMYTLGRRLAARTLPPVTIRELRLALQDADGQQCLNSLIDTLILSMGRRCETCLAVRGDHISY
ncbi:transposable element Tcb1 transposase [Trichonephila clavipes]|nr:transposable element Tcb1 transposase [Trichonephila clavipes]